MIDLNFINVYGSPVCVDLKNVKKPRVKRDKPDHFHMGFRVIWHPPGAFEIAKEENAKMIQNAEHWGTKKPDVLTLESWQATTKRKPLRSKPYELHDAASVCRDLAIKARWTCVEVVEVKG